MIARWHAVGFIDSFQTSLAKETAGNGESQANENREAQAATSPPNGPKCKFLKDLKNLFQTKEFRSDAFIPFIDADWERTETEFYGFPPFMRRSP